MVSVTSVMTVSRRWRNISNPVMRIYHLVVLLLMVMDDGACVEGHGVLNSCPEKCSCHCCRVVVGSCCCVSLVNSCLQLCLCCRRIGQQRGQL